nr:MAG TPA: hypothetical protein [Caudoviricetes sp.]
MRVSPGVTAPAPLTLLTAGAWWSSITATFWGSKFTRRWITNPGATS